jgi:hypothetical protein
LDFQKPKKLLTFTKKNNYFNEPIPALRSNLFRKKLFLQAFAGTSVGRPSNATKNSFFTKKDFHCNLGLT